MKAGALAGSVLLLALSGCARLPGRPVAGVEASRPDAVMDFATLYGQNCAACHGAHGEKGAAYDLANPVYEAWVDDAALTKIIGEGESSALMPAYAKSAGGFLTDSQVEALVGEMRTAWKKSGALPGTPLPPYAGALKGDAGRGQSVYQAACARCHQQGLRSITSPTYLALVNDQTLRTIIVAGRPDIGQPNWTGDMPGRALTDQEIADVVAWLASQRTQSPGEASPGAR